MERAGCVCLDLWLSLSGEWTDGEEEQEEEQDEEKIDLKS